MIITESWMSQQRHFELSFGGLNYSYSLFSHKISIEIIRRL